MTMRWSARVLNQLVAPGIASFVRAEIPDISPQFPQAEHWLANYFLNSVLGGSFRPGVRQLALGYLRRAHHGFAAYHRGRRLTIDYLEGKTRNSPRIRAYYDAIAEWEMFTLQASMAMDLYRSLNRGSGAFEKGNGSREQRLYTVANQVKHVASCVASGQCKETDSVPLWLTEEGIHSFGVQVSFAEAAAVLHDIATLADALQAPGSLSTRRGASED